jgi:hypothetical protein
MKWKTIKLSDYLEFVESKYVFLKITPSVSLRNYNSDNILKLIASLYRTFNQQVHKINHKFKWIIEPSYKVSFYIYMEKPKDDVNKSIVQFYFIVPSKHYTLMKDKIMDTWGNVIDINIVPNLPMFNQECTAYYLKYQKEDAMSLVTDKRNNTLLTSELSTLYSMEEEDRAAILFNFIPISQQKWRAEYENTLKRFYADQSINKNKFDLFTILFFLIDNLVRIMDIVLSSINLGGTDNKLKSDYALTDDTKSKKTAKVVGTQIICFAESKDKLREFNICQTLCSSFECIASQDNSLISRKLKWKGDILSEKISNAAVNKMSPREDQHLIGIASKEHIEEHNIIEFNKIIKQKPPKELLNGIMPLGTFTQDDGTKIMVYMPTSKNLKNLPFAVVGANRTGKSSYLANIAHYAQKGGECTIFFDFCGICETCDDINEMCTNVLNIDCSDVSKLQGMGYNEVRTDDEDLFRRYDNIKGQASQLVALINSVNEADRDLKTKMNKLLRSASLVVFLSNGCFKDIFEILQDHVLRQEYINKVPEQHMYYMSKHIRALKELDEVKFDPKSNTNTIVGTKYNPAISGILDRIDALQANTYMEMMLEKDTKDNFNLIDEMQKPQIICFRMPDHMFKTKPETDAYTTYWMSKIWYALKLRKSYYPEEKLVKVNVIIDEIYQVPHCEEFVKDILSQVPKFNARIILSCHHLNQLTAVRDELLNANGSYVLIAGCSKQNYHVLKEEMYPFGLDDLMGLKQFHSLNVIKMEDSYCNFVTKLPPPLKKHLL